MARTTKTQLLEGSSIPSSQLHEALEALLVEVGAPGPFAPEIVAEAEQAARAPDLPDADLTALPFVTLDPAGSMDLDQAMYLERAGDGFVLHYAIADVGAFVRPGSGLDAQARRRGQTLYAPHRRVPLHPPPLSEDGASLLPDQVRPAMVWRVEVGSDGVPTGRTLQRALVRSRGRFDYVGLQEAVDAGQPPEPFRLLEPLGLALTAAEEARGGASLRIPDQEIEAVEDHYLLRYRPVLPVEDWNAQLSLLTGMSAAAMMLDGGVGLLRTMPPPTESVLERFRRQAQVLGASWPEGMSHGDFLRRLDPERPRELALLHESASLFRGAGYTAFAGEPPEQALQAAVAAPYAHVTAPLRRLVDRFGLAVCEALSRGVEPPGWALDALPQLPDLIKPSDAAASALERASVDLAEAVLLSGRVGEVFDAVVVDVRSTKDRSAPNGTKEGVVQLVDPAVQGRCADATALGARVRARLEVADIPARTVRFRAVDATGSAVSSTAAAS